MGKLSQIQEMKLRVLTQTYGKTEKEALDWLAKDTLDKHEAAASNAPQKPAPKAQPKPTERRELRDKSGKQTTLLLTEVQAAQFDALCNYGKSEAEAMQYLERQAGGKFTSDTDSRREARRAAFAGLSFRPLRKQPSIARTLTARDARREHDKSCCPACKRC